MAVKRLVVDGGGRYGTRTANRNGLANRLNWVPTEPLVANAEFQLATLGQTEASCPDK
jgi:hypothetical protein